MTKVVFDISMSLDGFMTAANVRADQPLGDGGEPEEFPENAVYTFVTGGIEAALEQASDTAVEHTPRATHMRFRVAK